MSVQLEPRPQHGVSGYSTTGVNGDYQFQFHDHVHLSVPDASFSRYSLQQRGGTKEIEKSNEDFNQEFNNPGQDYVSPAPNPSQFDKEPENVMLQKLQLKHASKVRSHVLQRSKKYGLFPTMMENSIYEGFGQYDPEVQMMLRDDGTNTDYIPSMFQPKKQKHKKLNVMPPIRQNMDQRFKPEKTGQSSLVGTEGYLPGQSDFSYGDDFEPEGNDYLHDMKIKLEPDLINVARSGTGTHPAHSEAMLFRNAQENANEIAVMAERFKAPLNVLGLDPPPQPDIRPMGYTIPIGEKTVMEQQAGQLQQRWM